jgi:7-carboxy-7-deazaguanine synthase
MEEQIIEDDIVEDTTVEDDVVEDTTVESEVVDDTIIEDEVMEHTAVESEVKEKILVAPICEIFSSIQGEGKNIGVPSVFIRFFGCTLRCNFNGQSCDTPYAVMDGECNNMTVDEVVTAVISHRPTNIVFTGGEPTIHQEFIYESIEKLKETKGKNYYIFEMETNGTVAIRHKLGLLLDWCNISIKLKSSNQDLKYEKKRINHDALHSFIKGRCCFKFVINSEYDLAEILMLQEKYPGVPIYVMPEGITKEDILLHSDNVVQLAMANNFIFTTRLHILLWQGMRGV